LDTEAIEQRKTRAKQRQPELFGDRAAVAVRDEQLRALLLGIALEVVEIADQHALGRYARESVRAPRARHGAHDLRAQLAEHARQREQQIRVAGDGDALACNHEPYHLGNSASSSNVKSDAFYRLLATPHMAAQLREYLDPEGQALVRGYAAGVSRYVRELRARRHEAHHERCRDQPWLREIEADDLYLRFYKLNLLSSSAQFIDAIASAAPPSQRSALRSPHPDELTEALARVAPTWQPLHSGETGSNMYAFGRDVTAAGSGIVFGNPHFPGTVPSAFIRCT
jgi:hypothetical protein